MTLRRKLLLAVLEQIWRRQADGIYVLEYELPEKGLHQGL